ncbi:MAG: hypothetical protein HZB50_15070 [Chloroflexi bacterium]|nr:hypothetical protein [Chloroflexota bacterium]
MKISTFLRNQKHDPIKRTILMTLLMIEVVIIFLDISWSYYSFKSGIGTRLAQVAIAYHLVLLLGLVATGVGLGFWVDRMIRQKRSVFHSPPKDGWTEAIMNLWGYELKNEKEATSGTDSEPDFIPCPLESFVLLDLPARRGRKPTFTLERWLPIAVKWENRDPMRDAFTLGELISEHLGTNSDGSPIVSEQTYYGTWRPRAIAEIHRRAKSKKQTILPKSENA